MNYYLAVLKKYAVFSGRAQRAEYWYFVLFNFIIAIVLGFIDDLVGLTDEGTGLGVLGGLYSLAVLIPSIAVAIRRLHDTNRSGWWYLLVLIPFIGWLIVLYFMVVDGDQGENKYGPNPKGKSKNENSIDPTVSASTPPPSS